MGLKRGDSGEISGRFEGWFGGAFIKLLKLRSWRKVFVCKCFYQIHDTAPNNVYSERGITGAKGCDSAWSISALPGALDTKPTLRQDHVCTANGDHALQTKILA
jgi:hypothetical protein